LNIYSNNFQQLRSDVDDILEILRRKKRVEVNVEEDGNLNFDEIEEIYRCAIKPKEEEESRDSLESGFLRFNVFYLIYLFNLFI
jgi:hypothetical protein